MIEFLVQGSASEPYETVFDKKDDNVTGTRSCPAGVIGQCCKHRVRILWRRYRWNSERKYRRRQDCAGLDSRFRC
jgi:hypothetical protein